MDSSVVSLFVVETYSYKLVHRYYSTRQLEATKGLRGGLGKLSRHFGPPFSRGWRPLPARGGDIRVVNWTRFLPGPNPKLIWNLINRPESWSCLFEVCIHLCKLIFYVFSFKKNLRSGVRNLTKLQCLERKNTTA